jgi:hypothetical protein
VKRLFEKLLLFAVILVFGMTSLLACVNTPQENKPITSEDDYVKTVKGNPEPVYKAVLDAIGGSDVFPVGGFWGPFEKDPNNPTSADIVDGKEIPDFVTDGFYELLSDAGVNFVYASGRYWGQEDIVKAMDLAYEYNMGYFVLDSAVSNWAGVTDDKLSLDNSAFRNQLAPYINHPACAGIYVFDEPFANQFDSIGRIADLFYRENDYGNRHIASTLVGHTAANRWGGYDYKGELEAYIDKVNPEYLSFDYYVFDPDRQVSDYFKVLSDTYRAAEKAEIPFWSFLQAGGQWSDTLLDLPFDREYYPNENQFLWNYNTLLAYGSKGLMFFPMIAPYAFAMEKNGINFQKMGLIGADGRLNRWYYYADKANHNLQAFEHILMNAAHEGIIVTGEEAKFHTLDLPEVAESARFRELTGVSGDTMVGCFDYKGGTALYVVNYSMTQKQTIKLSFSDNYGYDVAQRGEWAAVHGKTLSLTLEAGEGALVVLR